MFLTNSQHRAQLAELHRQYKAQLALLNERLADTTAERDFYRKHFLEKVAHVKFPETLLPLPVVTTALVPVTAPNEIEQRKSLRLDRSDWTIDDREIYERYWCQPQRAKGVPDDELDYWYHKQYGNQYPLLTFTADA